MKSVIGWIKSNLVTVASVIVILASIGVIVWSVMMGGAAASEASDELNKMARQLRSFEDTTVPFPPANVDDPPESISNVVINEATLKRLDEVYGKMTREYGQVFDPIIDRNQTGHTLLVPGVLPQTNANHLRHETRTAYRDAFVAMLDPYEETTPDAPRLNAIGALNPAELEYELRLVEEGFRPTGTPEADRRNLKEQKERRAKELLVDRARSAHIYADTFPQSPGFPFQVDAWSLQTGLPSYNQIWNSHMDLWIQQDIVKAIGIANKVEDPELSVVEAPVKRLISITVISGNVGTDSQGGMGVVGEDRASGAGGAAGYGAAAGYGGGGYVGGYGGAQPAETEAPVATAGSPDQALGVNFKIGPSGRISNVIYDVRHARVVMIVDYQQLPALFSAVNKVNFMTVLDCQIRDVDEYEALLQGYVYGQGDAVRVDMLIESIWLREWTKQYMPDDIKKALGIVDPIADATLDNEENLDY